MKQSIRPPDPKCPGESFKYLCRAYTNRINFMPTTQCFRICDFCVRREHVSLSRNFVDPLEALESLEACLVTNPDIEEVIFSGGDPLTLPNSYFKHAIRRLQEIRPRLRVRIHSRVPVVVPGRIDSGFLELAEEADPIWFLTNISSPDEASSEFAAATTRLRKSGFLLGSHSVLMRGVNDSAKKLSLLFNILQCLGVRPHYLFIYDRFVKHCPEYRISIDKAAEIYRELADLVSGLALPKLAIVNANAKKDFIGTISLEHLTDP